MEPSKAADEAVKHATLCYFKFIGGLAHFLDEKKPLPPPLSSPPVKYQIIIPP